MVDLAKYKAKKEYRIYYYENYVIAPYQQSHSKPQKSQKEIERELQLGYMRALTKTINKKY